MREQVWQGCIKVQPTSPTVSGALSAVAAYVVLGTEGCVIRETLLATRLQSSSAYGQNAKLQKMKKYDRHDHLAMATWATDCAERVLTFFESVYPHDNRPRKALEVGRTWVLTGVFRMAEIRGVSLASHAAAREAKANSPASFAARAAGQAVATAHVPQHAFGGAYYALKAISAADPAHAEDRVAEERRWQAQHSPAVLKQEFLERVVVQKRTNAVVVNLLKDKDF